MKQIREWQAKTALSAVPRPALSQGVDQAGTISGDLIGQLRVLEEMKSAISGLQAQIAVAFDLAQRAEQAEAGVPAAERGKGVGAQVALARRESPNRGSRLLGLAKALVTEMPRTLAALNKGQLNEWRATLLVKETACLAVEDRAAVDAELAPDAGTFDGFGDRALVAAVKAAAYRRDPRSVAQRASHAATERTVSLRPAPDTMTYLTALLPVAQGVAAYAALTRAADAARSSGDSRGRGQVMADTLAERLTGTPGGVAGVELQLVMTDRTQWAGQDRAGPWARQQETGRAGNRSEQRPDVDQSFTLRNFAEPDPKNNGPVPEDDQDFTVWVRRLYTAPGSGELLAMDAKARLFPHRHRRFIQARDHTCRTPYCDAPIRHIDHIVPWHLGGTTTLDNGAGLCEACNHTKENPGWTATPLPAETLPATTHTLNISTPTGHTYQSKAPPLPGHSSTRTSGGTVR
ncbi:MULTISPECIES: HNH endonuclease [unclassified Arthrobacter]|uniref:HNH endonuclease n=1 Tax=unclassified Arthrobacter TaxID=235627 RepID=UPI00288306FF|nr:MULTISPECIES: DUF222 domain-containing protein [unclassified Arthrobacter]